MGRPTGFMTLDRIDEQYESPQTRVRHYKEFVLKLTDAQAKDQGARCMDCGVPFCNNGCPVHNIIPDWNDLVYQNDPQAAIDILHSTNNFPEWTGRICPAPCEAACTLNIDDNPVGIKSIERFIVDTAWEQGWIKPQLAQKKTGKRVAIVGSGPAGLACAQQLARVGHAVTVFEKQDRVGGLLRYGIPDFKLDKALIDRRIEQMTAEGVEFKTGVLVADESWILPEGCVHRMTPAVLYDQYDVVVLAGGSEVPRDLPLQRYDAEGVYFAMDFLRQQNKVNAGDSIPDQIFVEGKHVVVIGGGDTGSDCVGTSNRQGALSVTQLELMPKPPLKEDKSLAWPYWPMRLRTSSSHEEGCQRDWAVRTVAFVVNDGHVSAISCIRVEMCEGNLVDITGTEFELKADYVFLAMGFVFPVPALLQAFNVEADARKNVAAPTEGTCAYRTSVARVFAAGDVRRGQSLVVWAIREGRQCAQAVDEFLLGSESTLPR